MTDQEILDLHGNIGNLTGEVSRCTTKIEAMTDAVSELSGEFKGYRAEHGKLHDRENKAIHARLNALGAPRSSGQIDAKKLREWFILAAIVAAAVLSVWTSATTPTKADVTADVKAQTATVVRAAAALEDVLAEVKAVEPEVHE